jgi:cephalosporin-C deacetylase-like acetyl esterase
MHIFEWTAGLLVVLLAMPAAGAEMAKAKPRAAPSRAAPAPAAAKEDLTVLPPEKAGAALPDYLLAECGKCLEARRKAVAAIEKPEQVLERQKAVRAEWMAAVALPKDRTPLNPRTVATLDREGYRIEKVIYESRPGHHVTANLYLPKDAAPPLPGVLIPCGHDQNAKAAPAYQSVAIDLAMHGFAVLCYDPIGQGERIQTPLDEKGKPVVWGTQEHTLADIGARLVGWCAATYRIWDGIRSLDYLASRPEVDPNRLGCTGNSGGGTMTAYLMTTDERILAAAPSCYITSLERLFATIGPQDGEQNIPAQVARGIDHADYLEVRAPKPTLVLTGTKDFFDITGSWDSFREAKRLYGILGFGERVDLFEYPDTHGYSKPRREAALRFMRRWLQGIDEPATEPPLKVNSDAELRVTRTGQVISDFDKEVTVWDLNLREAETLARDREQFWRNNSLTENRMAVIDLAGIRPIAEPQAAAAGTVRRDGYRIEKLVLQRPEEVPVPALLFLPDGGEGKLPAVLYVDSRGKAADAAPGGPIQEIVKSGRAVLAIDARGWGETAPAVPAKYWSKEFPVCYLALDLGRPLLGQRVEDTLAALKYLASLPQIDASKLGIIGVEAGGPVALHAATLDERLGEVTLVRSIESWMEVVATPLAKNQLASVVPGALARYDLPDLVRALGPRPVVVRDPVDPTGKAKQVMRQ